jgi:hypothetical protein
MKRMSSIARLVWAVCATGFAGCAVAEDAVELHAFGTLAATRADLSWGDYTRDNLQPHGSGRSRQWTPETDSCLGAQISAQAGDFGAQLQLVSDYRPDGNYTPYLSWANLTYAINEQWRVRVGRIALDSFLLSDSRLVGLTYHSVRPPIELYRLLPLYDSDGVDTNVRWTWGGWRQNSSALVGRKTVVNVSEAHVHSTDVWGLFHTAEHGPWTLHLAYQQRRVDNQSPSLSHFYSVGLRYDNAQWIAYGEMVRTTAFTGRGRPLIREAEYGTVGYRVQAFTPFLLVSGLQQLSDTGQLPVAQQSWAVGLRWDWARHADLKLQWDHVRPRPGSYGTEQNVVPGTATGRAFQVATVTMDFAY